MVGEALPFGSRAEGTALAGAPDAVCAVAVPPRVTGRLSARPAACDVSPGVRAAAGSAGSADDRDPPEDAVVYTASRPAMASVPATTSRRVAAMRMASTV
jgi:hypothetical protein